MKLYLYRQVNYFFSLRSRTALCETEMAPLPRVFLESAKDYRLSPDAAANRTITRPRAVASPRTLIGGIVIVGYICVKIVQRPI